VEEAGSEETKSQILEEGQASQEGTGPKPVEGDSVTNTSAGDSVVEATQASSSSNGGKGAQLVGTNRKEHTGSASVDANAAGEEHGGDAVGSSQTDSSSKDAGEVNTATRRGSDGATEQHAVIPHTSDTNDDSNGQGLQQAAEGSTGSSDSRSASESPDQPRDTAGESRPSPVSTPVVDTIEFARSTGEEESKTAENSSLQQDSTSLQDSKAEEPSTSEAGPKPRFSVSSDAQIPGLVKRVSAEDDMNTAAAAAIRRSSDASSVVHDEQMAKLLAKNYDDDLESVVSGVSQVSHSERRRRRRNRKGRRKLGSTTSSLSDRHSIAPSVASDTERKHAPDGVSIVSSPGANVSHTETLSPIAAAELMSHPSNADTPRSNQSGSIVDGSTTLLNMNAPKRGRFSGFLRKLTRRGSDNRVADAAEVEKTAKEVVAGTPKGHRENGSVDDKAQRSSSSHRHRRSRSSGAKRSARRASSLTYSEQSYSDYASDSSWTSSSGRHSSHSYDSQEDSPWSSDEDYDSRGRHARSQRSKGALNSARSEVTTISYATYASQDRMDRDRDRRARQRSARRRGRSRRASQESMSTTASKYATHTARSVGTTTTNNGHDTRRVRMADSVVSHTDSPNHASRRDSQITESTQWEDSSDEEIDGIKVVRREYERVKFHLPLWFREVQVEADTFTVPQLLCGSVSIPPTLRLVSYPFFSSFSAGAFHGTHRNGWWSLWSCPKCACADKANGDSCNFETVAFKH